MPVLLLFQGQVLSQMLRKSVETRDWLNSVEPRTVRAVMKRVVEETTCIDAQVGRFFSDLTALYKRSPIVKNSRNALSEITF